MILKRSLLTIVALLTGPMAIVLTMPFYDWSARGGIVLMIILSVTLVYTVWRKPKDGEVPDRLWMFVRRCWTGELQLWQMFWIVSIGLSLIIMALSYAGTAFHAPIIWWILVLALMIPVEVWWVVSLWRCAPNSKWMVWTIAARVLVVIAAAYSFYTYFLVIAYPFGI